MTKKSKIVLAILVVIWLLVKLMNLFDIDSDLLLLQHGIEYFLKRLFNTVFWYVLPRCGKVKQDPQPDRHRRKLWCTIAVFPIFYTKGTPLKECLSSKHNTNQLSQLKKALVLLGKKESSNFWRSIEKFFVSWAISMFHISQELELAILFSNVNLNKETKSSNITTSPSWFYPFWDSWLKADYYQKQLVYIVNFIS